MQHLNFTERQGEVRFDVFPFKFVTHEILLQVHVCYPLNNVLKTPQNSQSFCLSV